MGKKPSCPSFKGCWEAVKPREVVNLGMQGEKQDVQA